MFRCMFAAFNYQFVSCCLFFIMVQTQSENVQINTIYISQLLLQIIDTKSLSIYIKTYMLIGTIEDYSCSGQFKSVCSQCLVSMDLLFLLFWAFCCDLRQSLAPLFYFVNLVLQSQTSRFLSIYILMPTLLLPVVLLLKTIGRVSSFSTLCLYLSSYSS